ncbi:hypothetical protein [Dyadobacter sp. 3J3]|uniref:hypothetical protein n=1 Tax=Dyadobacter sp. 3J3 TaxID=2606600 RepID=UPI00135C84D1|nr:hypothetical protein [Dyadobacter sp. 3J3]
MKRIKYLLILGVLATGCSTDYNDITEAEKTKFITKVKADPLFEELTDLQNQHLVAVASDFYGHSTTNGSMIKEGLKNCTSGPQMINLYKKAGMRNAEQYVENTDRIIYLQVDLKKKYPTLLRLDANDRKELFDVQKPKSSELQSIADTKNKLKN